MNIRARVASIFERIANWIRGGSVSKQEIIKEKILLTIEEIANSTPEYTPSGELFCNPIDLNLISTEPDPNWHKLPKAEMTFDRIRMNDYNCTMLPTKISHGPGDCMDIRYVNIDERRRIENNINKHKTVIMAE